jgi:hypothetical protein
MLAALASAPVFQQPRQPMDERLPSGESVNDLLQRQRGNPITSMGGQGVALDSPAPRTFNFPQPTAPTVEPPAPPAPSFPTPAEAATRVGYSTAGLSGLDKIRQRREALESADPESKVTTTPDFVDIGPPAMKGVNQKGRFRSGLEASLSALAHVDPAMLDRHPLYALGQGVGGLVGGIASPRTGAKITRHFDILDAQTDEARGLKLAQGEEQLGDIQAQRRQRELEPALEAAKLDQQREIENAKLEIERQKAAGLITKEQADQRNRELDRASREKIAADRITSAEKIAGMRGTSVDAKQAKRTAKINESSALYKKADNLESEATKMEQELGSGKRTDPFGDVAKTIAEYRKEARQNRIDGDKARAEGESIPEVQAAQPYSGRTMSQANLERYAKDKGLSLEDARKQVEAQGVTVQ